MRVSPKGTNHLSKTIKDVLQEFASLKPAQAYSKCFKICVVISLVSVVFAPNTAAAAAAAVVVVIWW